MNGYLLCLLLGALMCAVILAIRLKKTWYLALVTLVLSGALAIIFAKLFFVVCRYPFVVPVYGLAGVLRTNIREFSFFGGCVGVVLGAALTGWIGRVRPPKFLDDFAPVGALMVAVARCAEYFLGELCVGDEVIHPLFCRFPFAVVNEWEEWYFALFMAEAAAALIVAAVFFLRKKEGKLPGLRMERTVFYLCLPQILFENMRAEVPMRWGFVRIEQLFCAVCVVLLVWKPCRAGGKNEVRRGMGRLGVSLLCAAALVGIEFGMDRLDLPQIVWYGLMVLVLAVLAGMEIVFTRRCLRKA